MSFSMFIISFFITFLKSISISSLLLSFKSILYLLTFGIESITEVISSKVNDCCISNLACNNCSWCHQNLQRHCPNRSTLGIFKKDGCFSEYFTLPKENIITVPDNVDDYSAVMVEPLAAAYEIFEQLPLKLDSKIALVGDGKLGLCISSVLNALNLNFIHIGKHAVKPSIL